MDRNLLYRYFRGEATPEERHMVRCWTDESREHYDEFIKERKIYDASLLLGRPSRRVPLSLRLLKAGKIAAAAAAVFICGILFQDIISVEEPDSLQRIVVPEGQRVNVTLADGTDIWLNSGSELTYSTSFSKSDRNVTLDGEGYFQVAEDKENPFRVHTSKATVEVLGTVFNLKAYDDSPEFTASLLEGSVKLTSGSASAKLRPDESASLRNGAFEISQITDEDEFLWREGILCFGETPFLELMKRFENFYGVTIRVDNPDMADYSAMGKFRQSDGVEHALRVLATDAGFQYVFDDINQLIIIK